ncbi:MAG: hypothetical protein ACKOES_12825 [Planctomycetaceae bacterium]
MTRRTAGTVRGATARGGEDASGSRGGRLALAAVALVLVGFGVWMLLQPSRTARIVDETIALQDAVLSDAVDPVAARGRIAAITRNIDQLPPADIRRVRDALVARLRSLGEQSVARFVDAPPEERTALLDGDIARLQVARGIFEATDQGGMRPFTEAEIREREERRRMTPEERQQADRARRPAPEPSTAASAGLDRKLFERYFEALGKRAKEKKVDLGRMVPRPPGRG